MLSPTCLSEFIVVCRLAVDQSSELVVVSQVARISGAAARAGVARAWRVAVVPVARVGPAAVRAVGRAVARRVAACRC